MGKPKVALTTPDLVLLSLLAERPMHGYEANAELERRQIRDWAAISRPQIYYSLEKLARAGLLRSAEDEGAEGRGPERQTGQSNATGRRCLPGWRSRGWRGPVSPQSNYAAGANSCESSWSASGPRWRPCAARWGTSIMKPSGCCVW